MAFKFMIVMFLTAAVLIDATDVTINSYRMNPGSDPDFYNQGTLRITKKSRNLLVVSGTFLTFVNIGDDCVFEYSVHYKSPVTGNHRTILQRQMPFCEFINTDTLVLPKLREVSNIVKKGECPVPKGNYTIQNYKFELPEALPLPTGDYVVGAQFIKDGVMKLGLEWAITVLA
ncbi:uncharacterized protein LOC134221493 [Armigeres subalbatus]|uniref:uncharacterized protein LOC134221493 n=1 Tax=Armigeres subalbatus TaxID=124917 RepID=UPI002ED349F7